MGIEVACDSVSSLLIGSKYSRKENIFKKMCEFKRGNIGNQMRERCFEELKKRSTNSSKGCIP